jgi:peroxiredoxin
MSTSNKTTSIQSGDRAPSFTLPTQNGTNISLDDFLGKNTVVLFFYPKDDTSGCTADNFHLLGRSPRHFPYLTLSAYYL